jgi:GAF domain-containing protein
MVSDRYETERLNAVKRYEILDTPPDGSFDRITALASRIFNMPIAIISLVDHDRIWFKSSHGLAGVGQIDREPGLCASAILSDEVYLVENAIEDPRCLTNPLVCGDFGLRFYAAAPLKTRDGYNLGTLCIIDRKQRYINSEQTGMLHDLAAIVMDEMELRLAARTAVSECKQRIADLENRLGR